jgi:hypothetical protein
MHSEFEKRLEEQIDRELKALPDLPAPATLSRRVLASIQARVRVPWYRRAWQTWPIGLQAASLALLLALFGGLCFAGWQLQRMHGYDLVLQESGSLFSGVISLCDAFLSVCGALVLVVRKLGNGVLIAGLAAMGLAWAACLGLGTACVKLAWARR